jgi:hypothetical protein
MYASGASHHYKNFGKLSKVRDVAVNLRHSSNDMEHMLRQVGALAVRIPCSVRCRRIVRSSCTVRVCLACVL